MTYAHLEGRPVIIDTASATGYWFVESGKAAFAAAHLLVTLDSRWYAMHPADVTQAGLMTKIEFDAAFPALPPLPEERWNIPALLSDNRFPVASRA